MGRVVLRVPRLHHQRWRFMEVLDGNARTLITPCKLSECLGHETPTLAVVHHATHFCETAAVQESEDPSARKPCTGCGVWTHRRAQFAGCPFENVMTICSVCNTRELLRLKHFDMRGIVTYCRNFHCRDFPVPDPNDPVYLAGVERAKLAAGAPKDRLGHLTDDRQKLQAKYPWLKFEEPDVH